MKNNANLFYEGLILAMGSKLGLIRKI